jgi:hypothetical protein
MVLSPRERFLLGLKVAYKIRLRRVGKWDTIAFAHIIDALAA